MIRFGFAGFTLAVLAACGSDRVTIKDAILDTTRVLCHGAFRCKATYSGTSNDFTLAYGADEVACGDDPFAELYAAAEKRGTLVFNEKNFRVCKDKYEELLNAQGCNTFWNIIAALDQGELTPAPECSTAITGTVADGGACDLSAECARSLCNGSTMKCDPNVQARSSAETFDASMIWSSARRR